MSYAKHKQRWGNCCDCALSDQRRNIVLTRGKLPAPVLFVGDAPGVSEDVIGRPFVGPAGKLLDNIIDSGFDGQLDYAITNLVACFPKEAKATANHQPPESCIRSCKARLQEFCKLCDPQVVVCVGKLSTKWTALMLHGVFKGEYHNITHPAAILRLDVSQKGLAIQRAVVTLEEIVTDLE